MKLKKESVSARLYRWFYDENVMPTNLCPYFWKLLLMWLAIIPLSIAISPSLLIFRKSESLDDSIGKSFVIYALIVIFVIMIVPVLTIFGVLEVNYNYLGVYVLGIGCWVTIIWGILKRVTPEFGLKRKSTKSENSIIIEFVKAKYHKYCPNIDWE